MLEYISGAGRGRLLVRQKYATISKASFIGGKRGVLSNIFHAFFLAIILFFSLQAHASFYCDPAKKATITQQAQNNWTQRQAQIAGGYPPPNTFASFSCSANITSAFDNIAQNYGNALNSLIQNLIGNIFNQACQATLQPIKNIAALACIPSFNFNFDTSFLNGNLNTNFCNGQQLLNVNSGGGGGGGGYNSGSYSGVVSFY